jgi:hypothetical protein
LTGKRERDRVRRGALALQSYLYFLLLGWAESYYLDYITQGSTVEPGKINPWVRGYGYTRNIPVPANPMHEFVPINKPMGINIDLSPALSLSPKPCSAALLPML